MFCELPNDIQSLIVGKLNVFDRARLRVAIPKLQPPSKHCERRLGVLARAVKHRAIKKASSAILSFVDSVPKSDPTLQEVLSPIMPSFRADSIEDVCSLVRNASPDDLKKYPENLGQLTKEKEKNLLFNVMLYNMKLFDYVANNKLLDIELGRENSTYCCYSLDSLKTMCKHFSFTTGELNRMYVYCIESMYTESAEHIYNLMKIT